MARPGIPRVNLDLDTVEKKWIAEIKRLTPQYEEFDLREIAHVELKNHLFARVRELRDGQVVVSSRKKSSSHGDGPSAGMEWAQRDSNPRPVVLPETRE